MGNPFVIAEDLALKTHLQGIIVADEKVAQRPVKVWFGYPDVEIREQTWPFITIDLIDITPAQDRQHQGRLYDTDYRGTQVEGIYSYDYPIAYDISYQITTYARHPQIGRAHV